MSAQPDAVEIRVLGSLLEKQRTTPEAYPLSVNALRLACNQSTNRDPVVAYDERTVVASARKYRHLVDWALELGEPEPAVLAVLMLRGAQTPGELKQRTERLHPFADLAAIAAVLDGLIRGELVARLERRPGQKEQRYLQVLEGTDAGDGPGSTVDSRQERPGTQGDRIGRLELEVAELRAEIDALRAGLGG